MDPLQIFELVLTIAQTLDPISKIDLARVCRSYHQLISTNFTEDDYQDGFDLTVMFRLIDCIYIAEDGNTRSFKTSFYNMLLNGWMKPVIIRTPAWISNTEYQKLVWYPSVEDQPYLQILKELYLAFCHEELDDHKPWFFKLERIWLKKSESTNITLEGQPIQMSEIPSTKTRVMMWLHLYICTWEKDHQKQVSFQFVPKKIIIG